MADVSHLERMGRELKCPICLSLLNSAVSLTCNHVFCGCCIEKSMKSASDCPVCKVPYRRREVRPAPHMDNLVSVYKSMEVASGVNIFVTQNGASTKESGEDKHNSVNIGEYQDTGEAQLQTLDGDNQKQYQKKGSKRASLTNQRALGLNSVKPSFPTKKRVQVPQCPASGTHMQPEKPECGIEESKPPGSSVMQKDTTSICEKRKPNLSPFFWLREDADLEKSSQQTDGDQDMYTPPETPCFSDIKDSDDDTPSKINPEGGTVMFPDAGDFIDSEMFDWTQRPCSPELCSSQLAMQVEGITGRNEPQEKADAASTEATTPLKISPSETKGVDKKIMGKTSGNGRGMRVPDKRISNATETRQKKRAKRNLSEVTAVPAKVPERDMQENSANKNKMSNLREKNRKNGKVLSEDIIPQVEAENIVTPSERTSAQAKRKRPTSVDFSASENCRKTSEKSCKLKESVKNSNSNKLEIAQQQKSGGKVKAGKFKTVVEHINVEQSDEVLISHSNDLFGNDREVSDKKTTRTTCERKCKKMSKSLKKVKFSVEVVSKNNCKSSTTSADDEAAGSGKNLKENHCTIDQSRVEVPAKLDKAIPSNGPVMLKCKTFLSAIHCAFCQSSDDSEDSGAMVHYLNGKPVTESNDAVHVHKYCTEWAPNVYFEDDNVVNLENELSRSRRIRCSCCGKKGAALGCYEKSCRKSFHVPCARLTPECRWDHESFVMLCPTHATCQLPNEITKSQPKKRRCATERKSHDNQAKATDGCKSSSISPWKSQKKFKNLVLCCSALTNTEKEIVNKFENLSGVAVLKNWDSSVTHVIASTDENGACRRTLKFLMGVLEGKWILSVQWLKASMEVGEIVDEQVYEIAVDIHEIKDGPRIGRLRLLNKQPKLFDGFNFFFMGDFVSSYKGYLHDLVIAGGGKVLNRKPVVGEQANKTFVIYSLELAEKCRASDPSLILDRRRSDALAVANSTGSVAVSNTWILNSIAGYKLQNLGE